VVDVGARVEQVLGALAAAGYAREGDDDSDGRLDLGDLGDSRL
jgi:hypothetical protein